MLAAARSRGHEVVALIRDPADPRLSGDDGVHRSAWTLESATNSWPSLQGVAALVHAAAFIPPDVNDLGAAEECFRLNAVATGRLVEHAAACGVSDFLYLSGGALYEPRGRPAMESDPLYPAGHGAVYLSSKLAGELLAAHAAARRGIRLTVLRIASPYGPRMRPTSVVPRFIEAARAGKPLVVRSAHRADLVHVDDVAAAVIAAAERGIGGAVNLGSGCATSMLDLAKAVVAAVGNTVAIEVSDHDSVSAGFAELDCARARGELEFRPRTLAAGLRDMIAALAARST